MASSKLQGSMPFGTPVYSKAAVDELLAGKQAVLVFDAAPTEGSPNPVTSGGIYLFVGVQVREAVAELGRVLTWRGSVPTYADLPTEGVKPGDVYNVEEDGMNVAAVVDESNDVAWDPLGPSMAMYLTKEEASSTYLSKSDAADTYLSKSDAEDTYVDRQYADTTYATWGDLSNHVGDFNNPHRVTKAQVGLGHVDDTSDSDKPVSTAVQSALDLKQDNFVVLTYGVSTWAEFRDAYDKHAVIYCLNGSRMAIMGYVTATQVEFNYYRSIQRHTASTQGDQFIVYKLEENGVWSAAQRETMLKNVAGDGIETSVSEQVGLGTISYAVKPKAGGGIGVDSNGVYVDLSSLSSVAAQIGRVSSKTASVDDVQDVLLALLGSLGYTAS